nr:hypothetical protein [uncultured Arsenicibacter sp.]
MLRYLLLLLLLPSLLYGQSITFTTPALNVTTVCAGGSTQIGYNLTGFPAADVLVDGYLSDAGGSFTRQLRVLYSKIRSNGTYYDLIDLSAWKDMLPAGNGYRLKICVDSVCSPVSAPFTIAAPGSIPIVGESEFRVKQLDLASNGQVICPGSPARFELRNRGQADLQWFSNGLPVAGQTGMVFSTTLPGTFTVRATKSSCATMEDIGFARIGNATAEAVNVSGSTTINQNQTATITLTRPNPASNTYGGINGLAVYLSDFVYNGSSPLILGTATQTITVRPGQTTRYFVTRVSSDCGLQSNPGSGTATVTVNTGGNNLRVALGALPSATLCAGTRITLPFSTTGTFLNQNGDYNFRVALTGPTGQGDQWVDGYVSNGTVTFDMPRDLSGTGFRLRVISTSPYVASDYSGPLTIRPGIDNTTRNFIEPDRLPALCAGTGVNAVKLTARIVPYGLPDLSPASLTYQWYQYDPDWQANGLPDPWMVLSGATSQTYTATRIGRYSVQVSNGCGTMGPNDNDLFINVYGAESNPQLILTGRNPICQSEQSFYDRPQIRLPDRFYAPDAQYTWTRNGQAYTPGKVTGSVIRMLDPLVPTESGQYGLTVDHLGCPVTFPPVSISILPVPTLTITPQPYPASTGKIVKCAAEPVVLTGSVSGTGITSVAWWRTDWDQVSTTNSVTVTNANLNTYTFKAYPVLPGCTRPIEKTIDVVSTTPSVATLTVANDSYDAWSLRLRASKPIGLTSDYFTIQWYRNGQPFDALTTIYASYNENFLTATLPVSSSGTYTARVTTLYSEQFPTAGCTGEPSNPVSVSTHPGLTYFIPDFTYTVNGLTATFATNLNTPIYYLTDVPTVGASTQITSPYTFAQSGTYQVMVSGLGSDGQYHSVSKWVNVNTCPALSFTVSPAMTSSQPLLKCANGSLTLSVPSGLTSYTWVSDFSNLTGTNSFSYSVTTSGTYWVQALGANGCRYTSNRVIVRLNAPPGAGASLTVQHLPFKSPYDRMLHPDRGEYAYLRTAMGQSGPFSATVLPGPLTTSATQRPDIWEARVSPAKTTTYSLVSALNECGRTTFSPAVTATVEVQSVDVSLGIQADRTTATMGQDVVFTVTLTNPPGYNTAQGYVDVALPANFSFVGSNTLRLVNGRLSHIPQWTVDNTGDATMLDYLPILPGSSVPLSFTARAISNGTGLVQAQVAAPLNPSSYVWDVDSTPNSGFTDGEDDAASVVVTVGSCSSMITVKTGNWTDPAVWSCGRIPAAGDTVTIAAGHVITIGAGATGICKTVQHQGRLVVGATGRLRLGQN